MDETADSINSKNSILLSRNNPIALVVGAAGFLGSHLVDKLLDKRIQVIGVDDLQYGEKFNLQKATENRNFHLVIESPDKLDLDLPRLDYIFIVLAGGINFREILEQFRKEKSRCLLVSSINLYERGNLEKSLEWLKEAESRIAKFAKENNLN
ncbi:MAG: NAD-dependent epimerase/dehydratase family protein, partial [Candidatus Daviesbacteria bacterium]|nr:NAD-dependent epimerase/dehydratase family protein [Candidatus Daviesbacteria bacterium]